MKPVAAGARRVQGRLRNTDVEQLDRSSTVRAPLALRNPYVFAPAIAPHVAAREAGVELKLSELVERSRQLGRRAQVVVVEGAGGFCVPLTASTDMADLAERLKFPVVLVVGMRLGCLSHALLTAEAIERRGLVLAGWVANRIDVRMQRYRDNVESLRQRMAAPLLAEVPRIRSKAARQRRIEQLIDVTLLDQWLPRRAAS